MATVSKRPALTPREEERRARQRQRALEKAQREARRVRARESRSVRAQIIREELAKPRARACRCGIRPSMTRRELRDLGAGCTGSEWLGQPGWVCPVLDAIRRRVG